MLFVAKLVGAVLRVLGGLAEAAQGLGYGRVFVRVEVSSGCGE